MTKAPEPAFADLMDMMRNGNPQVAEDGFAYLKPRAKKHIDELIVVLATETNHAMKCWLLELIGEARTERAFVALCAFARSDDGSLREWAVRGLEKLNTKQARTFLFNYDRASIE